MIITTTLCFVSVLDEVSRRLKKNCFIKGGDERCSGSIITPTLTAYNVL